MNDLEMQYTPNKNLIWLLLRPWILFPRVIYILLTILFFVLRLAFQGASKDRNVQKDLSKYLFNVITDLGPCYITVSYTHLTLPTKG